MKSLDITLETVTPLLLHGPDPKGEPELRPTAFRGGMRFWFRAACAAVIGDHNLDGLRTMEAAVFGQSETNGAPVAIRIPATRLRSISTPILPHKLNPREQGSSRAFESGKQFPLLLVAYRPLPDCIWNSALASLALMTTFGGVGLRSRRGYGTLRVNQCSDCDILKSPRAFDSWKEHIQHVILYALREITGLARKLNIPVTGLSDGPSPYPAANRLATIRISDSTYPTSMDSITGLMKAMQSKSYYGSIKPTRQASPLWARVIQTGQGEYRLLLAVLASSFTGANDPQLDADLNRFSPEKISVQGWTL